eukprot:scaffold248494_cov22-Tisochrysis_lutea.AAC.1
MKRTTAPPPPTHTYLLQRDAERATLQLMKRLHPSYRMDKMECIMKWARNKQVTFLVTFLVLCEDV